MPISNPKIDVRRALARRLLDSAVGQIPVVGAPAVAIYSLTHEPAAETVIREWRAKITDKVNEIEVAVSALLPAFDISEDAASLAVILCRMCIFGHGGEIIEISELLEANPDLDTNKTIEACGELAHLQLIQATGAIGSEIICVQPGPSLFEIFDSIAFDGCDPRRDAVRLARHLVEHEELKSREYIEQANWSVRRFNPAAAIVCKMLGEGRVSQTIDPEIYPLYCFTTPAERAQLRRFAESEFSGLQAD